MKLPKKLETEILALYHKYWDAYLSGKIRTMSSLMDENIRVIGSGQGEVFKNKKETVKYYKATADQVAGKSEMRNRKISLAPAGDNILVTEESDFFILMGRSWTFYGPGRISTLFGKMGNKWLIIQQHGSLPDARTSGGEQVNTDKIKEENLRLKDAVKRRTIELEEKNRELEIEAALEKVRTRTMAMYNSEELKEVVSVLYAQLDSLGLAEWGCSIMIFDEASDRIENWVAESKGAKLPNCYYVEGQKHPVYKKLWKLWKQQGPPMTLHHKDKVKRDFDNYWLYETGFNALPEEVKSSVLKEREVYLSYASIRYGLISAAGYKRLPEEAIAILERLAKVFEQTYTRFLDLQKAEGQAREATIEAAFERVRARTMAMQKSTDLGDTSALLFAQLNALVPELWTCGFVLCDRNKTSDEWWLSGGNGFMPDLILPHVGDALHTNIYQAWMNGESYYEEVITGEALQQHYEWLMTISSARAAFDAQAAAGIKQPVWQQLSCAYFSKGYLVVITEQPCNEKQIFKRFAQVFDQTYTRFLDLQKAEAQAREAKIEAALERTRTQSMIMQHSKELDDTLRVFHEQVLLLGIHSAFSFLWLPDEEKDRHIFWAAWAENNSFKSKAINYPLDRNEPATVQCLIDWKGNEPIVSYHVPPSGVESYFAAWEELIDGVEQLKPEYFSGGLYYVEAFMKYGCFGVMVVADLREDEKKILGRFAIEFERTYTRFLDLQKAEAQAREGQIQLALERVRARTMAMQKSDELKDAAALLFQQVKSLGVPAYSCGYNIWEEDEKEFTSWMSTQDGSDFNAVMNIPLTEDANFVRYVQSKQKGEQFFVLELGGQRMQEHYEYLKTIPAFKAWFDYSASMGFELPKTQIHNIANFSQGNLLFITLEPCPEFHDVFKRFAAVFEQTYTRFLDLQKAEEQAREAQIEAALERVRSRSMGMQKSEELKEVIRVVYQQLRHVNINLDHAGFVVDYTPGGDWNFWIADEQDIPSKITHPWFDSVWANQFDEAKEKGKDFFETHLNFEEKNKFYNELLSYVPGLPEASKDFYLSCPALAASTVLFDNVSLYIENFSGIPYSDEENKTLMRFGKVFQQTYTRFNDLKQAEAQAMEARIEAALEKVRSRSLAMHKSDEIKDVVKTVVEKITELNIEMNGGVSLVTFSPGSKDLLHWIWIPEQFDEPLKAELPYFDHIMFRDCNEGREQGWELVAKVYSGEEKRIYFTHIFNHSGFSAASDELKAWVMAQEYFGFSFAIQKHSGIFLNDYTGKLFSKETNDILIRFSKVFEQSYIRFLDLQKAEAQVREAEIQLALERVRARTMAMQKSDELADAAALLFKQISDLGIETWTSGFNIWENNDTSFIGYNPSPTGGITPPYIIPSSEDDFFLHILKARQRGEESIIFEWSGEQLAATYGYMKTVPIIGEVLKGFEACGISLPGFQINHCVFFAQGFLLFITLTPYPEAHDIFKRFGKTFEQSYTRFLDLQKAEAQAREGQIQLAMERVRARTMAMQKSDELPEAANLLFLQVQSLGMPAWSCGYNILSADKKSSTCIMSSEGELQIPFTLPLTEHASFLPWYEAIQNNEELFVNQQGGSELAEHYRYMKTLPELKPVFEQFDDAGISLPVFQVNHLASFKGGFLLFITYEPVPEAHEIFKRFAKVFEQTYTRFLDLQKAEAQTRQAQIETAMERVRARAMAMQKPHELTEVAEVLRKEMGSLGVEELETSSIYIHNEQTGKTECWFAIQDQEEKKLVADHMAMDLNKTWVGREMLAFYRSDKKQISIVMQGTNRKEWINYCAEHSKVFGASAFYGDNIPDRTYHLYKFSNGYIGAAFQTLLGKAPFMELHQLAELFLFLFA